MPRFQKFTAYHKNAPKVIDVDQLVGAERTIDSKLVREGPEDDTTSLLFKNGNRILVTEDLDTVLGLLNTARNVDDDPTLQPPKTEPKPSEDPVSETSTESTDETSTTTETESAESTEDDQVEQNSNSNASHRGRKGRR